MATTQDKLSKIIAHNKALVARERKIQQRIKNETDPAKKAALQKRLASVQEQRKAGRTKRQDLQNTLNIEGVTGATNLAAAESLANKYTPELGHVNYGVTGYDPVTGNPIRNEENTRVLSKFESIMEKGLEAPEYQAEREQMTKGLTSDYRTAQNELAKAQARSKVFGAAGAAQQANLARADSEKRADVEQQLMLKGAEMKRQGLKDYAGTLAGMQDYEMQGQKVNLGQDNAKESVRLGLLTNMIGAGMGKDYQDKSLEIANKALDAAGEPIEFPDVETGTEKPTGSSSGNIPTGGLIPMNENTPNVGNNDKSAKTIARLRARNKRLRQQNSLSKEK